MSAEASKFNAKASGSLGQGEPEVALRYPVGFGASGAGNGRVVRWGCGGKQAPWRGVPGLPGFGGLCRGLVTKLASASPLLAEVLALNSLHFSLRDADQQQIANNPKYLTVHMQVVAPVCAAAGGGGGL